MDLKQLDYFVRVTELGSFTKAATLLSVAQSALSHQVRALEVELKQSLLYRTGRGVTPTEAGKRLLAHARGILMQVERARGDLAETRGAPVGNVVLGLPASIARFMTLPLFKAFRRDFPSASLGMVEGLSASVVDWLVAGRVDVGLVYNPVPGPAIEILPLHDQELFLISAIATGKARRIKPVRAQDVSRFPLIIPSRPNANRMRIEALLAGLGLKPQIALEIDGIASILDLVHEGFGYAILPIHALRGHRLARNFVASPFVHPKLTIPLSLVVSAQRPSTPLTRGLLSLARKTALQALSASNPKTRAFE
jgi:LysR family transcriptional regulator, nitrogen assimilation regulatory protein